MARDVKASTRTLALGALAVALGVVLLYLSSILPTARVGVAAIAGLLPAAVVMSGGIGAGFAAYAATALLAFLIVPGKGAVLVYALLLGHYPMVKSIAERQSSRVLEWLIKLAVFNGTFVIATTLARELFFSFVSAEWLGIALYVAANVIFVIYDLTFSGLIVLFNAKLGNMIRKGR